LPQAVLGAGNNNAFNLGVGGSSSNPPKAAGRGGGRASGGRSGQAAASLPPPASPIRIRTAGSAASGNPFAGPFAGAVQSPINARLARMQVQQPTYASAIPKAMRDLMTPVSGKRTQSKP